jgi:hypothetical protein
MLLAAASTLINTGLKMYEHAEHSQQNELDECRRTLDGVNHELGNLFGKRNEEKETEDGS